MASLCLAVISSPITIFFVTGLLGVEPDHLLAISIGLTWALTFGVLLYVDHS